MAAIANADVSISATGNIRWTGAATTNKHTVLEFIQYLMDKQDDAQAAGDDLLDITVDTPFNRSTDQILTLNSPFNIDDTFATHLYDGSVSQTEPTLLGETLYSGLGVIGPVETGTEYMILQNGKVLPSFWGTGINPEASPSLVFSRHLVKSKYAGSKIDGQRITVLARELSDQYRRFPVTLGTGNSVAAIGNGADIFNTTADATIAAWTIANTEGFQELNIDNTGAAGQEFYSQWDKSDRSINDVYERTKWISQRSHVADTTGGTPTGANFVVDDATTQGQAQAFVPLSGTEKLTEARFNIKIGGGTPTGTLYCLLYDSDDVASQLAEPTLTVLARSEAILASAITSSYETVIFRFNRFNPNSGADQIAGLNLVSATNPQYFIALYNDEGTASNFFHVQGASTDQDTTMNQASYNGTVWTAVATNDLNLTVKSSPAIHDVPGEIFQGINIEVGYDGEAGEGVVEDDICMWGTLVSYDTLGGGTPPFRPGELVTFKTGSTLKSGGTVLYDDGVDELLVALDSPAASVLTNNDTITGLTSGVTALVNFPSHVGNGTDDLDFSTAPNRITRTTSGASFITEGYKVGHKLVVTGSASNDGTYNITAVAATTIDVVETLTGELNVAATITLAAKDEELGGGTGIILAKDDNGATGEVYLQVLSGVNPVNNNRIRTDDVTADPLLDYVDATATLNSRTVIPEFLGTSTGSNIIGAYGIGFDTADVGASDRFTSLDNTSRVPPNNVVFTVSGLVAGEDRVLVGPRTGTSLNTAQLATDVTLSGAAETVIQCSAAVPTETPTTGTVRVKLNSGIFKRVRYQSNSGNDYTILADDTFVDGDVTTGTDNVTLTAHKFVTLDKIRLTTTGVLPAPLATGTDYYIIKVDANTVRFASSVANAIAGTQIDITSAAGGGTHTVAVQDFKDFSTDNATQPKDVFISYIDVLARATTESFTAVFTSSRNLIVRVRDGGSTPIKTFEATSAQFLSTAQTVAATRTSDA